MNTQTDRDARVLALREQGRPYSGIAHVLSLEGAGEALASFNRALRRRPKAEQERLRTRELARLDAVASRLRQRDDLSDEEVVRLLRGVKQQRRLLLVG
ncbi:MAG: hypothetical protein ACRDY1_15850 [Acidimicrobiales bacterium]